MPYMCGLIFHMDWNRLSNHYMNAAEKDRKVFNLKNTEMPIFACFETGTFKMV